MISYAWEIDECASKKDFTIFNLLFKIKHFMKKVSLIIASGAMFAIALLGWNVPAFAQGGTVKYPDFPESSHIAGPKLTASDLEGKVVLLEYWGIHCPPCIASMPHLEELNKEFSETEKLVIIGSHVQARSDEVGNFIKKKGITFPIYQWARIDGAPAPSTGIPFAVLISAGGKVIRSGHPNEVIKAVREEMKKFEDGQPIFPDLEKGRYKSIVSSLVYGGNNLEGKIKPLRSKDDEESKAICDAFDSWVKSELRQLKREFKSNPFACIKHYEKLKKSLPEASKVAAEKIDAMKKDRAFVILKDLEKKAETLEERKSKGRKVAERNVELLMKKLEPYLEDSRAYVKNAARAIETRLLGL